MRLKEADLADALCTDAAGGEVGDAAGLELDANVGDIDLGREDGEADGANLADGGLGEGENNVEIVNHEIEDDVDVEGARREDRETMRLKEHGAGDAFGGGGDGWVEAFEVADLHDAMKRRGESEDAIGFVEGRGEGFFDEDIDAGAKELFGDGGVMNGRNADGGGVDGEGCSEEIVDGGEAGDVVEAGRARAELRVRLDERGELDVLGVRGFELAVDAKVIAAEGSGANDCEAKRSHGYFFAAETGASTASRQRA